MNEQNQKPTNLSVHDIGVVHQLQKIGEDGKAKGYSFYACDRIGVVTEITEDTVTLKLANGESFNYDSTKIDDEYYFKVGRASEIEYERLIEKDIAEKIKEVKKAEEKLQDAMTWMHDFKEKVSIWSRIMRSLKVSK